MIINCILILVGLGLVLWGADRMTEGASSIARHFNVPEIVIGLTIVGAGTSSPELFVSIVSALNNTPDLAVGNVVGSNIMNTLLIVGVTAMVAPMAISRSTVYKDMPFSALAALLLIVLCLDSFASLHIGGNTISRMDGFILLTGFVLFMAYTFRVAKQTGTASQTPQKPGMTKLKCLFYILVGLAGLIIGSNTFVGSASAVAEHLGVSQSIIGLTIVAGGTSLPELATSVVAARKGQSAIAIGNVIGSNVFNILLILGTTAAICPMQIGGITIADLGVMFASTLLLLLFSYTRLTVERWEGAVLTLCYMAYAGWLIYNVL